MSFFTVHMFSKQQPLMKLQKISCTIPISLEEILVFYKDKSYEHYHIQKDIVLEQGCLHFEVENYCLSKIEGYLMLFGNKIINSQRVMICQYFHLHEKINVNKSDEGQLQEKQKHVHIIDHKNKMDGVKYFLLQKLKNIPCKEDNHNKKKQSKIQEKSNRKNYNAFLIKIETNIQNGIGLCLYDFQSKRWSEEIIHLSSRYLNYKWVDSTECDEYSILMMRESQNSQQNVSFASFILISNGERYDSFHYCKIIVRTQDQVQQKKVSQLRQSNEQRLTIMYLIVNREVKLFQHFIVIGADCLWQKQCQSVMQVQLQNVMQVQLQNVKQIDQKQIKSNKVLNEKLQNISKSKGKYKLVIAGNSLNQFKMQEDRKVLGCFIEFDIDILDIQNNLNIQLLDIKMHAIKIFTTKAEKILVLRKYMGKMNNDCMIFLTTRETQYESVGLHKISVNQKEQELYLMPTKKINMKSWLSEPMRRCVSCDGWVHCFEMLPFLGRIKNAPTLLLVSMFGVVTKKIYYKVMIEDLEKQISEGTSQEILQLL